MRATGQCKNQLIRLLGYKRVTNNKMDPPVEDTPVESILASVISKETQLIKDMESLMVAVGRDGKITNCLLKVIAELSDIIEIYRKVPQKCFKNFHKCLKYLKRHKKISIKTSMSYKIGNLYFQYEMPVYGMMHHSKVIEDILKNPKKNIALDLENYIRSMARFGKAEQAYQKMHALYQTNKGHDCNLALCLAELGQFDNALQYIEPDCGTQQMELLTSLSKSQEESGIISKELKLQNTIDILIRKGDYKKADFYSFTFERLLDPNQDNEVLELDRHNCGDCDGNVIESKFKVNIPQATLRTTLAHMKYLFKEGQGAFLENNLLKAFNVFQDYIKQLMNTFVGVNYNAALIRDAILRLPTIARMIKACLSRIKSKPECISKEETEEREERLITWGDLLIDVQFGIDKGLHMDGLLKALMYQSVICSCIFAKKGAFGTIASAPNLHLYMIDLYAQMGWYDELLKHTIVCDFGDVSQLNGLDWKEKTQGDLIEFHCKLVTIYFDIGYWDEAREICEFLFKTANYIKDIKLRSLIEMHFFAIYYKCQKNYRKCSSLPIFKKQLHILNVEYKMAYLHCLAYLNDWKRVVELTENNTQDLDVDIAKVQLLHHTVQDVHILRGWCYKNLKSYSLATDSFNLTIKNSTTPVPVFLQKIHTAYLRGQYKTYTRFLIKLFNECSTMKKLTKQLAETLRYYPYFEKEWVQLLNIISRYGRELMPYPKPDIQGFKLYRSSNSMLMHFSKIQRAAFE